MWRVWVRRGGVEGLAVENGGKEPLESPRRKWVDGWMDGWISRSWDVGIWTGLAWPRI